MSFSTETNGSITRRLADLAEQVMDREPIIHTSLPPPLIIPVFAINDMIGVKSPIFGCRNVKLEKQEGKVYGACIHREFDIVTSIIPSFPSEWVRSVELAVSYNGHYGQHDKNLKSSEDTLHNLFFDMPLVHSVHSEYRLLITLNSKLNEGKLGELNQLVDGSLISVDIFGIMLFPAIRTEIMAKADRIILDVV